MDEMTPRERFDAIVHFKKPDRLPFCEFYGFEQDTTIRWHKEGLPVVYDPVEVDLASTNLSAAILYMDYSKYFGFDESKGFTIDFGRLPRGMERVLEETDTHKTLVDIYGIKKKISKSTMYAMPQFLDWPVKTLEDFEKIKMLYKPDRRRLPRNWGDEAIEYYKDSTLPVGTVIEGFYANGRQLMGTVSFCRAFYKDPELVREMVAFHADFVIETLREIVESLKSSLDYVFVHEDMASRHGPNISPKLFREFMLPSYKKVTNFLRRNSVDTILLDTDGDPRLLIPLYLEAGITGICPVEVGAAGQDAVALRKEYGKRLVLIGNIDKRALARDKAAIEKEVEYKVPYLKKEGGYIPSVDHLVPPDVPYQNYLYYLNFLKKFL